MIFGIGIDLVELYRMEKIIAEKPQFIKRVLTPKEEAIFNTLSPKRKVEFLGGRFACKEAFSKAYGTGIGKVTFQDIEVLNEKSGQPVVTNCPFSGKVFVSISHSETTAMAQIILETPEKEGTL